jgi:hypothetical protein
VVGLSWRPASTVQDPLWMTVYQSPPPAPEMLNWKTTSTPAEASGWKALGRRSKTASMLAGSPDTAFCSALPLSLSPFSS